MNTKIEKMTLADLENIKPILLSDFDNFWNYNILKDEINSKNSIYIVAKLEDEIVGFAGIKIVLDTADIMNIVTKKTYRNKRYRNFTFKKSNFYMQKLLIDFYLFRSQ